jgi:hypothetical protein
MRNRWLHSLALSLGILVAGAWGVGSTASVWAETPTIQAWPLGSGPAAESTPAGAAEESEPAVTLDRPVSLHKRQPVADNAIQPTGLFSNRNSDPVAYSPAAGLLNARPLPAGPAVDLNTAPTPVGGPSVTPPATPSAGNVPYSWRPPAGATTPTATSVPTATGVPLSTAPLTGPIAGPGIGGAPIGHPMGDGCMAPGGDCCAGTCGGMDGCCGFGNCCADGCCNGGWGGAFGQGCCFGNRWYGSFEYLLWFVRGQPLPPLVTTGPVTDNPPGALGQPGTTVLFGGTNTNFNPLSGGRLLLGYWFGPNHCLGIEAGGFGLSQGVSRFSAASGGSPFLARPFTNALTGAQDIEAVATPNGLSGSVSAVATSQLWGAQANLRSNLFCGCNWFIDGLVGWRYLGLHESLTVQENLSVVNSVNPNLPAGSTFLVTDHFGTQNMFNGGQLGGVGEFRLGRWIFDLRATVALGVTQQFVSIDGSTVSSAPFQGSTTAPGGLLAQTSNMGRFSHDVFSVVPEIGINVGYQFTNHIRGFVGYNFLYWSSVVRPGNQIDPVVNPNLIPPSQPGGPQRPTFNFNGSDFWAQGITFGLDIRW